MRRTVLLCMLLAWQASACGGGPTTTIGSQIDRPTLTADAIGPAVVGDPIESVVAAVSGMIGDPDSDTGWIASDSEVYGHCPGKGLRVVGWGSLYALFTSDEDFPDAESAGAMATWTYGFDHATSLSGSDPRELHLTTAEGVGLGTPAAEAMDLYGDRFVEEGDAAVDVWGFTVDADDDAHLAGRLSEPGRDGVVTYLERIPGCTSEP